MSDARDTTEEKDPLVGGTVAARYRVVRKLAQGGMGVVYEATQEPLGRRVALKVIRGDASDLTARQRFEREAKAASALQDAHVVVVHDFGVIDDEGSPMRGGLFLAMEFIEGETLRQRLQRGRLSFSHSRTVVRQIAAALAHAHDKGLVHRDLKPENVILTTGTAINVKVLDFGLAKGIAERAALLSTSQEPLTRSGGFVGTPGYLSPEVIDGKSDDPRQDIYATGVMWWELLTGKHPFPAETPMKTLVRQMQEDPPSFTDLQRACDDDIPESGAALIRTMMAREPTARPKNGAALLERLDELDRALGASASRFDSQDINVDSNADTIAGDRAALSSPSPSTALDGTATVEARRRPPDVSAPIRLADPDTPSAVPLSMSMVSSSDALAHSGGGLPKRLILAVALASVVGTIGGAVVLKFLDDAQGSIVPEPQPPPPPPPPVVPAVVVTELHLSGVPTFLALKSVRDHLPPHSLRHYQKGRAELVFQGEISGALADQLTNLNIALDEGKHWHVEVSEIVGGTLTAELLEGAPTPDEPAPVLPDLLPDAGTLLAPDGLEP